MNRSAAAGRAAAAIFPLLLGACETPTFRHLPPVPFDAIQAEARKNPPPVWKLPLGGAKVDELRLIGPEALLVGLRADESARGGQSVWLVAPRDGGVLWRHPFENRSAQHALVMPLPTIILFRSDEGQTTRLLALDARDGTLRWAAGPGTGHVQFHPLLDEGLIVAEEQRADASRITAYALADGTRRWSREFAAPGGAPGALAAGSVLWSFHGGVEQIAAKDGSTRWKRGDLRLVEASPQPRLGGDTLLLVDAQNRLHSLGADTGKARWVEALDTALAVTSLFPLPERVYVRGRKPAMDAASGQASHEILAVSQASGKVLWRYASPEATVSNLIEHDGRVFVASANRVFGIDLESGNPAFATQITNITRPYPAGIRLFGDRIVFIGELMIAAVDAQSGKLAYRHGYDPLSLSLSLGALDSAVARNEARAGTAKDQSGLAELHSREATWYQNQATDYGRLHDAKMREYSQARSLGRSSDANAALGQAQRASQQQRQASAAALQSSIAGLGDAMSDALGKMMQARALELDKFLRMSIISSYAAAEFDEYAYRPHRDYRSSAEQYSAVSVVHLPSGRSSLARLSPSYWNFGIWNALDLERGVVYHNGIGMNPADYEFAGKANYFDGYEIYKSFLIAQPITIPKP